MESIKIPWTKLSKMGLPIQYVEQHGNYYVFCTSEDATYSCMIPTESAEGKEFNDDFKNSAKPLT